MPGGEAQVRFPINRSRFLVAVFLQGTVKLCDPYSETYIKLIDYAPQYPVRPGIECHDLRA